MMALAPQTVQKMPDSLRRDPGAAIARAAQRQMAEFLASDAARLPDVNDLVRPFFGKDRFEVPRLLPERLSYFQ